jgi:hypothetical protein
MNFSALDEGIGLFSPTDPDLIVIFADPSMISIEVD